MWAHWATCTPSPSYAAAHHRRPILPPTMASPSLFPAPPPPPPPLSARRLAARPPLANPITGASRSAAAAARCSSAAAVDGELDVGLLEEKKHRLLVAAQDTQRGLAATADQRAALEEALVGVECYNAHSAVDLGELDGTWRLQYTSAPDVLVLFEAAARVPFLQVGQIYQKFECEGRSDGGIVRNVVKWSLENLLEEQEGATLLVSAKFSVISKRNIYLQFEEVAVENIKISEQLQALIAPALLPRTFLSLQILQFLRTFRAQVPVTSSGRRSVGGLYYLSYLDRNMLLGRAVGGGGVFVFTRAQPL